MKLYADDIPKKFQMPCYICRIRSFPDRFTFFLLKPWMQLVKALSYEKSAFYIDYFYFK